MILYSYTHDMSLCVVISYSKRVAIIEPLVGVDLDVLLLTTSTACP